MQSIITTMKELLKYKLASDEKCSFCLNPAIQLNTPLYNVNSQMNSFQNLFRVVL